MASLSESIARPLPRQPLQGPQFGKIKQSNISVSHPKITLRQNSISCSANHTSLSSPDGPTDSSIYAAVLDSCGCPRFGQQVHAHAIKNGFRGNEFVETKLLQMYGKCGCYDDASQLFDKMPFRNLYSWTAILGVYVSSGCLEEAFLCFKDLQIEDVELDFFVFPVVLKICSGYGGIELGKQLHSIVVKYGFASNIYVGNALIDAYGKCGGLDDAKKVLDNMTGRDCISWNSMITACASNGTVREALEVLDKMSAEDNLTPNFVSWSALVGGLSQNGYDGEAIEMLYRMQAAGFQPNAQTLASVLPACARLQLLSLGKEIHGYITRHGFISNSFVTNGLIDLYRRYGDMDSALNVFSVFSIKNEVSFNTMIVGYCEAGEMSKAKEFFYQMELEGKKKDIISWNTMISGYVSNLMFDEALTMLHELRDKGIEADSFTLGSALSACADMSSLQRGREIHSYSIVRGLQSNPFVGGALVEMYSKCRDLVAARKAFNEVTEREISTWNALISGYARCDQIGNVDSILLEMKDDGLQPNIYTWNSIIAGQVENDHNESALQLFLEMQSSNLRPDIYTIGIVLPACSKLAAIEPGKQVHAYAIRFGYEADAHIGAALVDMYAKCGSIKNAKLAYSRIKNHNLVTRNSMLAAYAMHGQGEEGISFFRKLLMDGFKPDEVTFISVLSSCVHAGSLEDGEEIFSLMQYHHVKPTVTHYTCMVDLLSRAGQLNEAYEIVKRMPMSPDLVTWGALLGGCITHGNVHLGEIAANKLIELEPDDTGNHVMLANLYASSGLWSDLARARQVINKRKMRKKPGCSWIEDRGQIHIFAASDRSHKRATEIYEILDNLTILMRLEQD